MKKYFLNALPLATLVLISLFALSDIVHLAEKHVHAQAPPASNSSYKYIVTATTTVVRGNAGFLNTITINGGTAGTITLYDIGSAGCVNTPASGKFATIEAIGANNPVTLFYNLQTQNGICIVTAAATDVTVTYN